MEQNHSILKNLASIANGRDFITTEELAHATNRQPQTVRKKYCLEGEYFGLRPTKFGNRLLWSVADTARLLTEGLPDSRQDFSGEEYIQPAMDILIQRRTRGV